MRIEDLSVNERILIHLRDFSTDPGVDNARLGQTQEGIAEAVGIRVNHVPRATKKLKEEGYLDDALVHVGGLKRKRRAYFLTARGRTMAAQIISDTETCPVNFRDARGSETGLKVRDILFRVSGSTASKIILAAFRDGIVVETLLQGGGVDEFSSNLDTVPAPEYFIDREAEREKLESMLDGRAISFVTGMKGIGKTSLVRTVMEKYAGRKNVFWYTAHTWDTTRNMLEAASNFYVKLGRNEMKRLLRQSKALDIGTAAGAFIRDINDSDSVIVLDGLFGLRPEVTHFLTMLCERHREMRGCRIIFITRDSEGGLAAAYRRELGDMLVISGLDRDNSLELMEHIGLDRGERERVYIMTQGHPLAMNLVNTQEIGKVIDTTGLTKEEVWVVRCLKAFDAIFE